MTKPFINIVDPRILAIPIVECNEALIDLKNQSELLYGPIPESELTKNDYTKMRKTVYEKLCKAQKDLPNNYRFRIYEAFRSLLVQKMLFNQIYQDNLSKTPALSKEDLFYKTTQLISPIINLDGSINIPPHSTGAAIDIEIIDQSGKLIDMGMDIKDWIQVDSRLCESYCQTISATAKQNRQILFDVMSQHGFINYPSEWWHFSYGDRYWAYFKGKKNAIYGSVN